MRCASMQCLTTERSEYPDSAQLEALQCVERTVAFSSAHGCTRQPVAEIKGSMLPLATTSSVPVPAAPEPSHFSRPGAAATALRPSQRTLARAVEIHLCAPDYDSLAEALRRDCESASQACSSDSSHGSSTLSSAGCKTTKSVGGPFSGDPAGLAQLTGKRCDVNSGKVAMLHNTFQPAHESAPESLCMASWDSSYESKSWGEDDAFDASSCAPDAAKLIKRRPSADLVLLKQRTRGSAAREFHSGPNNVRSSSANNGSRLSLPILSQHTAAAWSATGVPTAAGKQHQQARHSTSSSRTAHGSKQPQLQLQMSEWQRIKTLLQQHKCEFRPAQPQAHQLAAQHAGKGFPAHCALQQNALSQVAAIAARQGMWAPWCSAGLHDLHSAHQQQQASASALLSCLHEGRSGSPRPQAGSSGASDGAQAEACHSIAHNSGRASDSAHSGSAASGSSSGKFACALGSRSASCPNRTQSRRSSATFSQAASSASGRISHLSLDDWHVQA